MKRIALLLCLLLLLPLAVGCAEEHEDPRTPGILNGTADPAILTDAVNWFEESGFRPDVNQNEFLLLLRSFRYDGKDLVNGLESSFYNGKDGVGIAASSKAYAYSSLTITDPASQIVRYSHTLGFTKPLENFPMIWGVSMGDTLEEVIAKIGIDFDPGSEFIPNEGTKANMNLLTNEASALTFIDHSKNTTSEYVYSYSLVLTERMEYRSEDSATGDAQAVRSITLEFDQKNVILKSITVRVDEYVAA